MVRSTDARPSGWTKWLVVFVVAVLVVAGGSWAALGSMARRKDAAASAQVPDMRSSAGRSISAQEAMTFGGIGLDEQIAAMSESDAAIARDALAKDQAIEVFEFKNGDCLLVSAAGRRIHPDPAADRAYVDGYKDTYDPKLDTKYWSQESIETSAPSR